MSIINKMHQDLQEHREASPVLSNLPPKKQKKRVLLFTLISLLLASSIGLSYLIYEKEEVAEARVDPLPAEMLSNTSEASVALKNSASSGSSTSQKSTDEIALLTQSTVENMPVNSKAMIDTPVVKAPAIEALEVEVAEIKALDAQVAEIEAPEAQVAEIEAPVAQAAEIETPVVKAPVNKVTVPVQQATANVVAPKAPNVASQPHLEIKKSILSTAQLADIHLKNAEKALLKGDSTLVAEEKMKALRLMPNRHDVRQSLALYYYGIGEQERAKKLLKRGALQFPEHADFNLMLSRIALKNEQQQKAYLYLQQHPPAVEGNLDYHVSYAILAQKFNHYEKAESLYQGLLTQRPNNGRWRMSLAIMQDKQGKERLAVNNYQRALLQTDLSNNAKKYINQRLTYLANQ